MSPAEEHAIRERDAAYWLKLESRDFATRRVSPQYMNDRRTLLRALDELREHAKRIEAKYIESGNVLDELRTPCKCVRMSRVLQRPHSSFCPYCGHPIEETP